MAIVERTSFWIALLLLALSASAAAARRLTMPSHRRLGSSVFYSFIPLEAPFVFSTITLFLLRRTTGEALAAIPSAIAWAWLGSACSALLLAVAAEVHAWRHSILRSTLRDGNPTRLRLRPLLLVAAVLHLPSAWLVSWGQVSRDLLWAPFATLLLLSTLALSIVMTLAAVSRRSEHRSAADGPDEGIVECRPSSALLLSTVGSCAALAMCVAVGNQPTLNTDALLHSLRSSASVMLVWSAFASSAQCVALAAAPGPRSQVL
jgi:hypothetical protein